MFRFNLNGPNPWPNIDPDGTLWMLYKEQMRQESNMIPHDLRKFKIHGVNTVRGEARSSSTKKFYDTFEEALDVAKLCVTEGCWGHPPANGIVIMEVIAVVEPDRPPVRIRTKDSDGYSA